MRTIEDLTDKIKALQLEYAQILHPQTKDINRFNKRIVFLRSCVMYLENEPPESFLKSELEDVKAKIGKLEAGEAQWIHNTPEAGELKNPSSAYRTLVGLPVLIQQQKTLEYLLNEK